MAKGGGKGGGAKKINRDKRKPQRALQNARTKLNKQRQREKHAKLHPNDKDSLKRAKRWV